MQKLAESPQWFLDLWSEVYYDRKVQMEATRTAYAWENSKPNKNLIPGETAETMPPPRT